MGLRDTASQQSRAWWGLPAAAAAAAICLSGCASISQKFADTASQMPQVGLPANAPERPAEPIAYPAVHDVPPPRTAAVLTDIEQQKLETDLVAARDQQQTSVGIPVADRKKKQAARNEAAKNQAARDQGGGDRSSSFAPISASSSRTIY
jgi:hypothetical protein